MELATQPQEATASFGLNDAIDLMGSMALATQAKAIAVEAQIAAFDAIKLSLIHI